LASSGWFTAGTSARSRHSIKLRELREQFGFTPQEPVRWLSRQLAGTAVKALLAGVLAGYFDKREVQAVLGSELLHAPLRERAHHGVFAKT